jgi:hypothetical protein
VPNPENTVQGAAQRAGESYLDTCELEPDAIRPATSVALSFRMTLPEFFAAEQEVLCRAKKTSEVRMTAPAPHSYGRLPKPTRGYSVRCSVGRNSTRLNPLRNVSQVAVLGQLVSDGAHSILDPASRFLGLSHHHQVASAGEWYGKGFHTRSKFSDARHRSVDAVTDSAVNRKDRAGSRQ